MDTDISDLREYVEHIRDITHMGVVGSLPDVDEEYEETSSGPSVGKDDDDALVNDLLGGATQYMSCFLSTRSVFGEDAFAHISVELNDGKVEGMVRVRSVTEPMAQSLSTRIRTLQKSLVHKK